MFRHLTLCNYGVGISSPAPYLFRDLFSSSLSTGNINGSSAIPGPGIRATTDTENKISIAGGKLVVSGGKASPAFGDPSLGGPRFSRVLGRAVLTKVTPGAANKSAQFGWDITPGTGGIEMAAWFNTDGKIYAYFPSVNTNYSYSAGVEYEIAVICQNPGYIVLVRQVGTIQFETLWVDKSAVADMYYVAMSNYNLDFSSDDWRVTDLTAPWNDNAYTTKLTNPAGNTAGTHAGDAILDIQFTYNGTAAVWYCRYISTQNRWWIHATAAGALELQQFVDGTGTIRATTPGVFSATNSYRLVVKMKANVYTAWVNGSLIWTYIDPGSFLATDTHFLVSTFVSGGTQSLTAWPVYYTLPITTTTRPLTGFFPYGDSKTAGTGSSAAPYGYPSLLSSNLNTAYSTNNYAEFPTRIGVGGTTVATRAAAITTDLSSILGTPVYILCNLGANDVGSMPAEAAWKANYLTILDTMHAKWPTAQIYIMRPWRRGFASECDSLAAWIADIVTLRSSFCHLGPDERVFLENGDNGVTYTTDGIHPNDAGYDLTASQWRTVIGL